MLHFTANDNTAVQVPASWEEAKTKHFQGVYLADPAIEDRIKIFAGLTGAPYDAVAESNDKDLEAALYQATAFVFNQPQDFRKLPVSVIKIRGKICNIPEDVGEQTIGQNMKARQLGAEAERAGHCMETLISKMVAIYLQPAVDGPEWNYKKALELEKEILEMPIWDTFPIGNFYARKLANSGAGGLRFWLRRWMSWIKGSPRLPEAKSSSHSVTSLSSTTTA